MRVLFERNWRYLLFATLTVLVLWAFYMWRMTLLPFFLGLLLAYLTYPSIKFIERLRPGKGKWLEAKRVLAIFVVFVALAGLLGFGVFIVVTTLMHSSGEMINNVSEIINNLISKGQHFTEVIRDRLPVGLRNQADTLVGNLGNSLTSALSSSLSKGSSIVSQITGSLGVLFGFAATPLFLFYLLKDSEKIQNNIYAELSPVTARHAKSIVSIIECVLGRYIRGEIILGSVVGSMSLVGLLIIGAPFAVPLAVFNGFCEMIPTVGPIVGGVVMSLVALALAPQKFIWVVVLAIVVQLLENNLLVPRIQASCLKLHPALTIFLLVTGGYFWGLWGLILTVPLTATLVGIFTYVRRINGEANKPAQTVLSSDVGTY
jgi:predicted PurR-regulated permease PerM